MFKFVESAIEHPIRLIADPGSRFVPGCIGQISYINNNPVCSLSDGTRPFGIIADYKKKHNKLTFGILIRVYPQRMVFRTDEYANDAELISGAALYSNSKGRFTTNKPNENSYIIGRVITGPVGERRWFEGLFL